VTLLRAALTGATGFLGLHLLPALLQAGYSVRILARRDPSHPSWEGLNFETVRGGLEDTGALAELVRGADLVIHSAGLIKARGEGEFLRVNRDGTVALAAITRRQAPQARFLQISSIAAREPGLSDYSFSKHAAELAARVIFADASEQLAIIRPPAIYGPWDKETLPLFQSTQRRFSAVIGRGKLTVIHASDAADAIIALAAHWRPGQFTLADDHPQGYRMRDLLLAGAKATGGTPRLVQLPDPLVLAAGRATGLLTRISGKTQIFGLGKAREALHPDWSVSPEELLPAEIFVPRFGLAEGFADTVAWYRRAGWL
jgi:nucleoside-diphosphate-sugar epimerase